MLLTFQDSKYPQDESRCFTLTYYLASDEISIFEKPGYNSGFCQWHVPEKDAHPQGRALVWMILSFYSPADFAIGATLEGEDHSGLHLLVFLQMGL